MKGGLDLRLVVPFLLAAVSPLPFTVNDRQVLLQLGNARGRGCKLPLSCRGVYRKVQPGDAAGPGRWKGGAAPGQPSRELVSTLFLPENRHSPPSGLPETFSPTQNLSQESSLPANCKLPGGQRLGLLGYGEDELWLLLARRRHL